MAKINQQMTLQLFFLYPKDFLQHLYDQLYQYLP